MTTMLENARLAFKNELFRQDVLWHDGESSSWFMMTRGAVADLDAALRAVLLAVREPDDAMLLSARHIADADAYEAFTAMIDAILNEASA